MIFIACHTPYQIISVWRVVNPTLGHTLNPVVHRLLFACGVLPTIVDPIAYAKFLIPITNELKVIMSRRRRCSTTRRVRWGNGANGGLTDPEVELTKLSVEDKSLQTGILDYSSPALHSSISSSRSLLNLHNCAWMG